LLNAATLEEHFTTLNSLSPHQPGSSNHTAVKNYIIASLKKAGAIVDIREFSYTNPFLGPQKGFNIIGTFSAGKTAVAFASHWDTRPVADQDMLASNHTKPVFGANDGNATTAILLALADKLGQQKNNKETVHLIFFDAEDSGNSVETFCIGAQRMAASMPITIRFGILIDMVGDKDLNINYEGNSYNAVPELCKKIWKTARTMGYTFFNDSVKHTVIDDHVPFLEKGIPFVDIIDFDYAAWHTVEDKPANCSIPNMKKILSLLSSIAENSSSY